MPEQAGKIKGLQHLQNSQTYRQVAARSTGHVAYAERTHCRAIHVLCNVKPF